MADGHVTENELWGVVRVQSYAMTIYIVNEKNLG